MVLDEQQFRLIEGNYGAVQIPTINSGDQRKEMKLNGGNDIEILKNGYLYIFVSNESKGNVHFDDLEVTHIKSPLVEETHYYPFGLTMKGLSSKSVNSSINGKGFNGNEIQVKEFSDNIGLELYDFNARFYDPQLGRFLQIDPLSDKGSQESFSSYQFGYNNPIKFSDPDGKFPIFLIPLIVEGVKAAVVAVAIVVTANETGKGLKKLKENFENKKMNDQSSANDKKKKGPYQDRLPRKPGGEPQADPEANGPHTQLGKSKGGNRQAREFDEYGNPVKDIDFTGEKRGFPNPHQHSYLPSKTGGTPEREKAHNPLVTEWERYQPWIFGK